MTDTLRVPPRNAGADIARKPQTTPVPGRHPASFAVAYQSVLSSTVASGALRRTDDTVQGAALGFVSLTDCDGLTIGCLQPEPLLVRLVGVQLELARHREPPCLGDGPGQA